MGEWVLYRAQDHQACKGVFLKFLNTTEATLNALFLISLFLYSVFLPETVPTTQAQLYLRSECLWVFIIFSFVYLRPV